MSTVPKPGVLSSVKGAAGAFVTGQANRWVYIIIAVVALILGLVFGIGKIAEVQAVQATPGNVKRIGGTQVAALSNQHKLRNMNIKNNGLWRGFQDNEKLLINVSMVGSRLLGYLGPFTNGVFDEDSAVKIALKAGARLFILDIDIDNVTGNPILVYRDNQHYVKSLNKGSIKKTVDSLVNRAFSNDSNVVPSNINDTPVILILYFHNTPDKIKETAKYINFLGKVSTYIQSVNSNLLGQTSVGDFHRQAMETQIWFQPWRLLKNKIILLTNVDTAIMRNASKYGIALSPIMDLDYIVNATIYNDTSFSSMSAVSASSKKQAAVIRTPSYFLNTPPDRIQDVVDSTKQQLTICMDPSPTTVYSKEDLDKLITNFGVNCVPIVNFMSDDDLKPFFGKDNLYDNKSFIGKLEALRFTPPVPITTKIPSPATDTKGGFVALKNY